MESRRQFGLTRIEAARTALLWFLDNEKFFVFMGPTDDDYYVKTTGIPKSFFHLAEKMGLVRLMDASNANTVGTYMWFEPTAKGEEWIAARPDLPKSSPPEQVENLLFGN